jgi:L-iditol 2-dehydrogenase
MGGFAEYGKGPTYRFYKLPENVSYEDAALLDCISMGVHAANRSAVRLGNSVVVLGAGAIGLSTIAVAAAAGARVYCIGHHDFRLKAAKEVGAIEVFNRKEKDPREDILRLTGGIGADIVMETVGGHAKTIQQGIELARRGGVIAILGVFTSPQEIDMNSFALSEIDLIGVSSYSSWGSDSEFAMALDLISTGKINVKPFVTHRFPLQEINTAFETSVDRKSTKAIKVLVIP